MGLWETNHESEDDNVFFSLCGYSHIDRITIWVKIGYHQNRLFNKDDKMNPPIFIYFETKPNRGEAWNIWIFFIVIPMDLVVLSFGSGGSNHFRKDLDPCGIFVGGSSVVGSSRRVSEILHYIVCRTTTLSCFSRKIEVSDGKDAGTFEK